MSALRRLFTELLPYRTDLVITVILALVLAGAAPLRPWLIQEAVDGPVTTGDLEELSRYGMLVLGILLLESGLRYLFGYLSVRLGQAVVRDLRSRLYHHLSRYKPSFYDARPVGTLSTRVINDLEAIAELFAQGFLTMAGDLLQLVVVLTVMTATDWRLTLVSLTVLPLLLWATWWFKDKVHLSFSAVRSRTGRLNAFLQERLSNLYLIPLFHREHAENEAFAKENKGLTQAHLDGIWYYSVFFPAVEILTAVAMGLMVWYGALQVQAQTLSPGVLVAFLVYINQLFRPMRLLADKFNSLQMGLIAAGRVFDLLDKREWPLESKSDKGLQPVSGQGLRLQVQNLSFAYRTGGEVLHGIGFEMEPGEVVALVGKSGSGKSTLAQLLVRFYDPVSGRILVDGINTLDYPLQDLRRRMIYVPQDLYFFEGTVLENITLLDAGLSSARVMEWIERCNLDDFLGQLPEGLHSQVGERGMLLSAGQRQVVALLRAMVRQPDLLILDEATASIDSATEVWVQRGIEHFVQGRNALLIAHRWSTLRFADRVLVMEAGRIVREGKATDLPELEELMREPEKA